MVVTNLILEGGEQQILLVAGQTVIRGSQFKQYTARGLIIAGGKLDLGTAAQPGNNRFASAAVDAFAVGDARPMVSPDVISVSATSFNGVRPPAQTVTKSPTNPGTAPGVYVIQTDGNTISFF